MRGYCDVSLLSCNLTTLTGDITISYSEDTNKAKVLFSDLESSNGIFHGIDTVLVPPDFQIKKEQDSNNGSPCSNYGVYDEDRFRVLGRVAMSRCPSSQSMSIECDDGHLLMARKEMTISNTVNIDRCLTQSVLMRNQQTSRQKETFSSILS
ncbi:hypothetical protein Q8A67_012810 [Cirrhinus molitorella]|uniref:FAS1 domain-containing protein n=1 Tax=Cirrhinus molitorella TaxID=172907 RepID=A0AA88PZ17_9TELE|nr:hypothetical protein Q8A67_012810 [Cirrhinus molitorella]